MKYTDTIVGQLCEFLYGSQLYQQKAYRQSVPIISQWLHDHPGAFISPDYNFDPWKHNEIL